jgi:hypothetical protein
MGTLHPASEIFSAGSIFLENQEEALHKNGHQNWYRLVLDDFNNGEQFETVIHKYESWSEPSEFPEPQFRGVRGAGDPGRNRARAVRRAKKKIRFACKSAKFDRMLTLTMRHAIFDRDVLQKMIEKFIRLARQATGDALPYVLTVEKHDSEKTSAAKRGSLHAHVAVRGRQDYKLLQSIWNYRVCGGQGFVRVSNGTKKMNPSRIASYISKYIGKSTSDVAFNKKSYWISHNISAPVRTVKLFRSISEAVSWMIELYVSKGVSWGFDKFHSWEDPCLGVYWFSAG